MRRPTSTLQRSLLVHSFTWPGSLSTAFTCAFPTGTTSRHPAFPFALRNEGEIYVMSRDGDDLRRLTASPGWDGSPVWSPDDMTLYFYSERDEHLPYRIYSVALGSGETQPVGSLDIPTLSPAIRGDGRIVFATWTAEGPIKRWHARSVSLEGEVRDESRPGIDCLIPQVHRGSGAMVCQGGPPFEGETVADDAASSRRDQG